MAARRKWTIPPTRSHVIPNKQPLKVKTLSDNETDTAPQPVDTLNTAPESKCEQALA